MAFEYERAAALRILQGIEQGILSTADSYTLVEAADPTLVYLIITWLRTRYRSDPAAEGVIGRLVELCEAYPAVTEMVKQGKEDSVVEWFEDGYSYRALEAEEFVDLIVDKLES
ncbi:hypothetical protein DB30_04102 [Enhygromyxa salina]|uniref:Uncharacterized protein n=1 Tax=Enhygromyxa salina TaxID=215803 RepID=A0A0C2A054_9BACT|nr:hypothetical protein [Enhygromyxa salina]KIG16758.1 hypothetical protein DB30_04102 [Enhygromyxa salina]